MRPQSPFFKPVASEAAVPGKDGSSAALQAEFDAMLLNTFVVVTATRALYYKGSLATYASGNRIVQLSSGASGGEGVDGVYTCDAGDVINDCVYISAANTVAKANATAVATGPAIGFIVAKLSTTSCVVRSFGEVGTETNPLLDVLGQALVADTTYYVSLTAGKITSDTSGFVAGNFVQKVGEAKNTTTLAAGVAPTFGGSFIANNGTASDPTFTFGSDPGTGMYRSAASTIAFSLGGFSSATMATSGFTYTITSGTTDSALPVAYLVRTTTGTPAAGIGTALGFVAEAQVGANVVAGSIEAAFSDVTPGAELAYMTIGPSRAGDPGAGLRVAATMQSTKNGLEVRPVSNAAAAATGVSIAPYAGTGGATDITVSIAPVGAANILLNGGATGGVQIGVNAASKVGFYATAPIVQPAAVANCTVAADGTSAGTQLNLLLAAIRSLGIIST